MIILKALMCIIILIVVPALVGMVAMAPLSKENRSLGLLIPLGFLVMLVIFELVTIPVLLTTQYENFKYVVAIYTPIILLLCAAGVYILSIQCKVSGGAKAYLKRLCAIYKIKEKDNTSHSSKNGFSSKTLSMIIWIIAGAVLVFILVMSQTKVMFDGDDAYYVVQSLITQQNGSMYVTMPYTGGASPIDMRHAMAVFTMWVTYVGTMTGIHTTIICHSVLPLVLIPLSLLIYSEIGIRLLKNREELLPYYVLIVEVIILFGRVSLYTSENFLLSRTWQGKSLAGNVLIPMTIFAIFLLFTEEKKSKFAILVLVNAVAGIFSSLAVMLICILMAAGGFWYGIYTKKVSNVIRVWLCCIPGVLYMILYLYYTYFGWR